MVKELKISGSMEISEGEPIADLSVLNKLIAVVGDKFIKTSLLVGLTEIDIPKAQIAEYGFFIIVNTSHILNGQPTGVVHYLAETAGKPASEIRAGEFAIFRIPAAESPKLISSLADTPVEILLMEN